MRFGAPIPALLLLLGPILLALGKEAEADDCAPKHPSYTGVNSHSVINLVYSGQSSELSDGAAKWNDSCESGIPDFAIRSEPQSTGLNVTVEIYSGMPQGCGIPDACACRGVSFNPTTGEVVEATIRVGLDAGCGDVASNVAHELGHLLGLTDTEEEGCEDRIMWAETGGPQNVQSGDCSAVDDIWLTGEESGGGGGGPGGGLPGDQEDGSPILIDLDRDLFHLTGLGDPVLFDIDADGDLELLSWTSAETLDAFIWLDRNDNGTVDDGAELFGNHTPLIDGSTADNGYIPLAELDLPALGGNGNGRIDPGDVIYPELQLWIDGDHNGVSEPDEIFGLAEAGVTRIGLVYLTTPFTDHHGNHFRYVSLARILVDGHERFTWTTDVFFVVGE